MPARAQRGWCAPFRLRLSQSLDLSQPHGHAGVMAAVETREQILTVAERLFAELGVGAVSNRRIGEAAGQGNNTVVGYHFGTKAELVRAIVRRHTGQVEE